MKLRLNVIAALFLSVSVLGCGRGEKGTPVTGSKSADYARRPAKIRSLESVPSSVEMTSMSASRGESHDAPTDDAAPRQFNTETYDHIIENPFLSALQNPLSTFSIDVDTASYANVRRFLTSNQLPPPGAVRIEELINYFSYNYPQLDGSAPFAVNVKVADCPWKSGHQLVRIGLKGREIKSGQRPVSNLVFLLDVSGSMQGQNKLPLVKAAMKMLVDRLGENDRIAIVVYAGASGLVLPSTTANQNSVILSSLDTLQAGGSTNGGDGIQLAYDVALRNYITGGINRVILCTDGDFNIGVTNQGQLTRLVEEKKQSGVFLSVLGFGTGNYKDSTMEKLADKGNGNYAYIDTINEAQKVLVEEMSGTLVTIAKDVKIQIDFNPAQVRAYRLLGYENRMLRAQDFRDDTKDAGEIGAGHTVTALYEIVPAGSESPVGEVELSKYRQPAESSSATPSDEILTVRLRYKEPDAGESQEFRLSATTDQITPFDEANDDFRFAAAVAQFGMQLRDSKHKGEATFDDVLRIAQNSLRDDPHGYRAEFVRLAQTARNLQR